MPIKELNSAFLDVMKLNHLLCLEGPCKIGSYLNPASVESMLYVYS